MGTKVENYREIRKQFAGFVSRNILGMIGMSCYYVADTFFVAQSQGADGVAALNIVSPPYYLIFAVAAMISNGSAIIYKIRRAQGEEDTRGYFTDALYTAILFSLPFVLAGVFIPGHMIKWMGGDAKMIEMGTTYMRIIMLFAPMFICNNIVTAYVRNDNQPEIAMRATLISSIFNIVADYIFMFPMNMGMMGAALASGFAPIVSVSICCTHIFSKNSNIHFVKKLPDFKLMKTVLSIGGAVFATEVSTAVVVLIYNFLILGLTGNMGLAAYGVVSNIAIFVKAIFRGISEGSQPLLSEYYGKGQKEELRYLFRLGRRTAFVSSTTVYALLFIFASPIAFAFNKEASPALQALTITGIRYYFLAYIFGSFNTVCTGYFSATANAKWAGVISVLRSFVAMVFFAVVLAKLFGMNGVWLSYAATEVAIMFVVFVGLYKNKI